MRAIKYSIKLFLLASLVFALISCTQEEKHKPSISEKVSHPVPFVKSGIEGGVYTVKEGDDLWDIADKYLWPNIYRVNLDEIGDPDILEPGQEIQVPSFDGTENHWTDKDLKDIAEGHIQAYFSYHKDGKKNARYYLWVAKHTDQAVYDKYADQVAAADKKAIEGMEGQIQY